MEWHRFPSDGEDDDDEVLHIARYDDERDLFVKVLYETESKAILEATILGFDKEEQKPTLEYYYERVFVGFGEEDLHLKMNKVVWGKKIELEMIASGQDCKIIDGI